MLPIKIEQYATRKYGLNVTVIGIGEIGKSAVKRYPFYSDHDALGFFHTLTFLGDSALRNPEHLTYGLESVESIRTEISEIIKQTDCLFIVADISHKEDLKNALYFAERHKSLAKAPFTVLVEIENHIDEHPELQKKFDLIISVEGFTEAHKPIRTLIGIPAGDIGLDFADVMLVAKEAPVMKFAQESIASVDDLERLISLLEKHVAVSKQVNTPRNMLAYFEVPQHCNFDMFEKIGEPLNDAAKGGDILSQIKFHCEENDNRFIISLLYGAQNKAKRTDLPKWKMLEFSDSE